MPVEEQQLQQFFTTIQGGAQYPISSAESLIADNGDPLFNVVNEVTYAWNGAVAEAHMLVTMGAAAVTTGMALLTAPVSAPVVAIGLALGLTSGYLLYELQPEVFNDIAEELEAAGQTIGGKVISFVNADGQTGYTETTIDIIKNKLLSIGAFKGPEYSANVESLSTLVDAVTFSRLDLPNFPNTMYGGLACLNGSWSVCTVAGTYYGSNFVRTGYVQTHPFKNSPGHIEMVQIRDRGSSGATSYTVNSNGKLVYEGSVVEIPVYGYRADGTRVGRSNCTFFNAKDYIESISFYYGQFNSDEPQVSFTIEGTPHENPYYPNYDNNFNTIAMGLYPLSDQWGELQNGTIQDGATIPTGDPISTTYPNWDPWTVPQEIPDLTIFPVSEPVPDGEQDPAQTGDNDDPDQIQSIWDKIFIPDPPEPDPVPPEPEPVPDPDPQPVDPEPVPDPDPVPPEPDPIPPNPPIPPSPIPIPPVLPADVGSNAMFTVYNPSLAQVNAFGGWLWSANIIDMLLRMWTDPLEGIIAFQKVYAVPTVGAAKNIKVGYVDSEVPAPVVTSQFVTVNCGAINVDEVMHNATDYTPYSSLYLYLPFIGFVELDANEFMAGTITVTYHIDVYTGTCLAEVSATRNPDMPNSTIIYTFSGNASQQLPLTSSNFAGAISSLVSAVGGGLSIASGGGVGAAIGIKQIGHSLTHEMIHIGRSGSLSANAGIMGGRTPFIIIGRRHGYDANAYNELYGYPANKTVYLSNCHGFTRVKAGFLRSKATEEEKDEIMSFLQEGVIL